MRNYIFLFLILITACNNPTTEYSTFEDYPAPVDANLWPQYKKDATVFTLWSPTAEEVKLNLYEKGDGGEPFETKKLKRKREGIWSVKIKGDLNGTYYTYQVNIDDNWLQETPGIYAQAVGVNGNRAMVIDLEATNPKGWADDKGPETKYPNEAIIYELHVRDVTIHPNSGSSMPGKYLGLVEAGTKGPEGVATGIDHLKELGITHVHLLPAFDHYSIDETRLDSAQFNWGYDPQNYNVPEGSYATDPYNAEVRVREFKQMVQAFHEAGIGVILDVVYNHTGRTEDSNFNLEVPGYYYRHREDGSMSDASACGNETASERAMMRKFMIESFLYWADEYHLDGFRVDLMGIHDIETMNLIADTLEKLNPNIFVYGEGWTAGSSPLPSEKQALKKNTTEMPLITAFSDDIRDGLKGSVFVDEETGFVSGANNLEESVKFGVVGSIQHEQIDYAQVNYSDAPWANEPWQAISYVSCHDNHTIYDKISVSRPDASEEAIIAMIKLANAVVLTSQGIPFLHAGAEMLRTKYGEHNSYNLPDSINRIDWSRKTEYAGVVEYYKNLIVLRKAHPAFRMTSAEDVRNNLEFQTIADGVVSYTINNHANNDAWKEICVIYNARPERLNYSLDGTWKVAVKGDKFDFDGMNTITGEALVPPVSMMVLFRE